MNQLLNKVFLKKEMHKKLPGFFHQFVWSKIFQVKLHLSVEFCGKTLKNFWGFFVLDDLQQLPDFEGEVPDQKLEIWRRVAIASPEKTNLIQITCFDLFIALLSNSFYVLKKINNSTEIVITRSWCMDEQEGIECLRRWDRSKHRHW